MSTATASSMTSTSCGGMVPVDTVEAGPSSGYRCTADDKGGLAGWNHSPRGNLLAFGDVFIVDVWVVLAEQPLGVDVDVSLVVGIIVLARG